MRVVRFRATPDGWRAGEGAAYRAVAAIERAYPGARVEVRRDAVYATVTLPAGAGEGAAERVMAEVTRHVLFSVTTRSPRLYPFVLSRWVGWLGLPVERDPLLDRPLTPEEEREMDAVDQAMDAAVPWT